MTIDFGTFVMLTRSHFETGTNMASDGDIRVALLKSSSYAPLLQGLNKDPERIGLISPIDDDEIEIRFTTTSLVPLGESLRHSILSDRRINTLVTW